MDRKQYIKDLILEKRKIEEEKKKIKKMEEEWKEKWESPMKNIEACSLEEIQELFHLSKEYIPFEQRKWIIRVIKDKEEEKYPEYKKARYLPVLRKIDFISDSKVKELDNLLNCYKKGDYLFDKIKTVCRLSQEEYERVIEFLLANQVIYRDWSISCDCENEEFYLSDDEYQKLVKYCSNPEENEETFFSLHCPICGTDIYIEDQESFDDHCYIFRPLYRKM